MWEHGVAMLDKPVLVQEGRGGGGAKAVEPYDAVIGPWSHTSVAGSSYHCASHRFSPFDHFLHPDALLFGVR